MEANMLFLMTSLKKIGVTLLGLIVTALYRTQKKITSLYQILLYSNLLESKMAKRHKHYETETVVSAVENHQEESAVVESKAFNLATAKNAYSIIENNGKYHVVSVKFDPNTLTSGEVKLIESNTDKFLMQERLNVLLLGDDVL